MQLHTIWFIIITVFWVGFFVLDGFDFGVGMLHRWIGESETDRRVAINTIGPWWDGNEVWLIIAGASLFAAFPGWYATMFSAFYLALVLLLMAIFARGVSFEWRGKRDEDKGWLNGWSWALTIGSALIPFLLGLALGDLLNGLPVNAQHNYTGSFWDLLTGYGVMTGVTLVTLCLLHGATFLALRTTGELRIRARTFRLVIGLIALIVYVAWMIWTLVVIGGGTVPQPTQLFGLLAVIFAWLLAITDNDAWAFFASSFAIAAAVGQIFIALYPNVMISSTNRAYNLTVNNASAGHYSLFVMTIFAVLAVPIVLLYQGWSFRALRGRLTGPRAAAATADGGEPAGTPTTTPPGVGPARPAAGGSGGSSASS